MAFIVEDGTGLANSTSYAAVAEADAYFLDRSNAAWAAAVTGDKQAALIKATLYVDQKYLDMYRGMRTLKYTQALQWPRSFAIDRNGYPLLFIPQALKNGVFEAALIFLGGTDVTAPLEHGGAVKEEGITKGLRTIYQDGADWETRYPAIELALKVVLNGGVKGVRLVR